MPILRFYFLRLYQGQPLLMATTVMAAVILLFSALLCWESTSSLDADRAELAALRVRAQAAGTRSDYERAKAPATPTLPWFESADLVAQLTSIAEHAALPIDEAGYSLDEGGNQPYMRYRVTMTVIANYPAVRRFVREVVATLHNVDLDAITCKRSDITAPLLSCDLAFSAFYRKEGHG